MRFWTIVVGLTYASVSWCQGELVIPAIKQVMQQDRYNPALAQDEGWQVGLPSLYYEVFHSGTQFSKFVQRTGNGDFVVDPSGLSEDLKPMNRIYADLGLQTVKAQFWREGWLLGFEHNMRSRGNMRYTDQLVRLYLQGNEPFLGESLSIGPEMDYYTYNDYALTIGRDWSNITVALRPHLLMGLHLLQTGPSVVELFTDPDFFATSLTTDYVLSTNFVALPGGRIEHFNISALSPWQLTSTNAGFALDIGVCFSPIPDLNVAMSISDWGSIRWQEMTRYSSNKTDSFSGAEVLDVFELEQISVSSILDSLYRIFDFETDTRDLTMKLRPAYSVMCSYDLDDGIDLFGSMLVNRSRDYPTAVAFGGTHHWQRVSTGLSASYRYRKMNAGLHFMYRRPSWLLFLVTEQMLGGLTPFSRQFAIRLGANLRFQEKVESAQPNRQN